MIVRVINSLNCDKMLAGFCIVGTTPELPAFGSALTQNIALRSSFGSVGLLAQTVTGLGINLSF